MISVIILTYNRAEFLSKCLESVLSQTYKDIEVIIMDDGSTDNTRGIISYFNDSRIKYFNHGRVKNISKLRNIGVKMSRGELIAFCDDDDVWVANKLQIQLEYVKSEKIICTSADVINSRGQITFKNVTGFLNDCYIDLSVLLLGNCIIPSSVLIYKSLLVEAGLFNEVNDKSEDYDMWVRLANEYKIFHLNMTLVYYRVHDKNLSLENLSDRIKLSLRNIDIIVPYVKSKDKFYCKIAKRGIAKELRKISKYYYDNKQYKNSFSYYKEFLLYNDNRFSFRYIKRILIYIYIYILQLFLGKSNDK